MTEERNWRDAKPKWVIDAAEKEMADMRRKLALRWPDEARPEPLPFRWVEYDTLVGVPVPGTYWFLRPGSASSVTIREKRSDEPGWEKWRFNGKTSVVRGSLYTTEKEARLECLWRACDDAAKHLETMWEVL